jgi:hypothetical protein
MEVEREVKEKRKKRDQRGEGGRMVSEEGE